jgi:hypothetical protein
MHALVIRPLWTTQKVCLTDPLVPRRYGREAEGADNRSLGKETSAPSTAFSEALEMLHFTGRAMADDCPGATRCRAGGTGSG